MNWRLSQRVDLDTGRIPTEDARRQTRTAREILRRLDDRPGIVLADEVGMGKTFVALAAAASVIEATEGSRPVLVMVPPSVAEKWPREWEVFRSRCLGDGGSQIRATDISLRNGADFLKLLDDPMSRQSQLIFLTHGALTNTLTDPIIRMAIVRRALKRPSLAGHRNAFVRHAPSIMRGRYYWNDQRMVRKLLETNPRHWRRVLERHNWEIDDDPVPEALLDSLPGVNLDRLAESLRGIPLRTGVRADEHLRAVRTALDGTLAEVWSECTRRLKLHLPLLVLDEAHHTRNPNTRLAGLFEAPAARRETELLGGALNGVFDRMLFLTATPFQLAHSELIEVLRRFASIRWSRREDHDAYLAQIDELNRYLDSAQTAAIRLDESWSQLRSEDVAGVPAGWPESTNGEVPARAARVAERYADLATRNQRAQRLMQRFVIRHVRGSREHRRDLLSGSQIVSPDRTGGLHIDGTSVMPFLLAARTQALVAAKARRTGQPLRAHFAEGLASSFEAYRRTRSDASSEMETDATRLDLHPEPAEESWYLREIDRILSQRSRSVWRDHPKISATVERAIELWERGEKVLVFCFFVSTGRALREHISRGLAQRTIELGAKSLGVGREHREGVVEELRLIGERFMDRDRPLNRYTRRRIRRLLMAQGLRDSDLEQTTDVVIRFLRTPAFLVRFFSVPDLRARGDYESAIKGALRRKDGSGVTLADKIRGFGALIATREDQEKQELLEALSETPTGTIFGARSDFDESEGARRADDRLPNVRLANGGVRRDTRRRLMLTFNTPFFPEILVASSVMGEGVDLHLNCRNVIHHDLDWNPSVLEQRTGRIDRLGSLSERSGRKIQVYEPFVEGTQDEKLFRVVKDRERWFNVMMGEPLTLDEWSTEVIADRPEFPATAAAALAIDLSLK